MDCLDLAFRLTGARIPVDHGYALYAAVSRVLPGLHADREIGIHPIRGHYIGGDAFHLSRFSRLILRLPPDRIPHVLKLAGKILDVDGDRLRIGVPEVRPLRPVADLYSRLVTIKGFMDGEAFLDAARRQLVSLGVDAALQLGKRRTLRVKDKRVVGFELAVDGLDPQASLQLQAVGLGGRRHMGCGVFAAAPRSLAR
jgi:CRISPR-associated protein Cas6